MAIESPEIRDFIAACQPFDQLSPEALNELSDKVETRTCQSGGEIYALDAVTDQLYLIRSGAVELRQADGSLLSQLGEREMFGERSLLQQNVTIHSAAAIEDSLLYCLPGAVFLRLYERYAPVRDFFGPMGADRLHGAVNRLTAGDDSGVNLMAIPLADLIAREPVALAPGASIREAAQTMAENRVSSILVVEDKRLCGIVTDRDLRIRVIAAGLSYEQPLSDIMTREPRTVASAAFGFEALLAMARHNVHHLPVMDGERVAGMITTTDLLERRSTSAVYLVGDIYKRRTPSELAKSTALLPQVLRSLIEASASSHSVGHVTASIDEASACRLLQLAEAEPGPPPVPYVWLAAGSLGRYEQTALSDQDNCLLLADAFVPAEHGAYFEALSRYVCDGLNDCGYVYCPGDVMAITPQWCQPLAVWKRYFDGWIEQPEPKALMLSSIFFDLRPLYGDRGLFQELSEHVLAKSKANRIFLAFMTGNALTHQPPLGFFRNFVLIKGGDHDHTLDLKHNGVVPIVDLARIYCLASGLPAVNTQERLEVAAGEGELSRSGAADLLDALEFIGAVRLEHQVRRIKQGEKPDNFVSPDELSHFERNHLKDAFSIVRTMQSALSQRFQGGRL